MYALWWHWKVILLSWHFAPRGCNVTVLIVSVWLWVNACDPCECACCASPPVLWAMVTNGNCLLKFFIIIIIIIIITMPELHSGDKKYPLNWTIAEREQHAGNQSTEPVNRISQQKPVNRTSQQKPVNRTSQQNQSTEPVNRNHTCHGPQGKGRLPLAVLRAVPLPSHHWKRGRQWPPQAHSAARTQWDGKHLAEWLCGTTFGDQVHAAFWVRSFTPCKKTT